MFLYSNTKKHFFIFGVAFFALVIGSLNASTQELDDKPLVEGEKQNVPPGVFGNVYMNGAWIDGTKGFWFDNKFNLLWGKLTESDQKIGSYTYKGSTEISFHGNRNVKKGTLKEPTEIDGVPVRGEVEFHSSGKLYAGTLSKDHTFQAQGATVPKSAKFSLAKTNGDLYAALVPTELPPILYQGNAFLYLRFAQLDPNLLETSRNYTDLPMKLGSYTVKIPQDSNFRYHNDGEILTIEVSEDVEWYDYYIPAQSKLGVGGGRIVWASPSKAIKLGGIDFPKDYQIPFDKRGKLTKVPPN